MVTRDDGPVSQRDGLLHGRVAVVTGGAGGIGTAIARAFAEAGASGAVIDQPGAASGLPDNWLPGHWVTVSADVCVSRSLEAAFSEIVATFEKVDVVVANAGIVPPWTSTEAIDLEEWERVFAVNTRGVMLTIRQAVRAMSGRGGAIVAMSSLNGWKGDPHIPSYVASKHAVVGLVRSVAADVGRLGIRVNAVAPGPIATDALLGRMAARSASGGLAVEEALSHAGESTALGRIATVDEVANCVLFLASDLASGVTGQLLPVDAGIL
jgi:NAD(P)-dependent dehydrogenase (short-subunit alcohol dehydrogenase family)